MKTVETFNIYGEPITLRVSTARRPETPKGYAAHPGTGPEGETCKSCRHSVRIECHSKNFWKCGLLRERWTSGYGTDIRARSPACSRWGVK